MRLGEIVTEAPKGVGYRGWVAGVNQRHAAKKANIDYSNPAVKKKLAAQNYTKWIAYVKKRRNQIDMSKPETYKAELLKFFSGNGKVNLGDEFKARVTASKLSTKDLKGLVGLAIDARAAAKAAQPAADPTPAADPAPAADADGQGNMDLRGGSGDAPTSAADSPTPAPGADPADGQGSFDFDSKPAEPLPTAKDFGNRPRRAPANKRWGKIQFGGRNWARVDGQWKSENGTLAPPSMATQLDKYAEENFN